MPILSGPACSYMLIVVLNSRRGVGASLHASTLCGKISEGLSHPVCHNLCHFICLLVPSFVPIYRELLSNTPKESPTSESPSIFMRQRCFSEFPITTLDLFSYAVTSQILVRKQQMSVMKLGWQRRPEVLRAGHTCNISRRLRKVSGDSLGSRRCLWSNNDRHVNGFLKNCEK